MKIKHIFVAYSLLMAITLCGCSEGNGSVAYSDGVGAATTETAYLTPAAEKSATGGQDISFSAGKTNPPIDTPEPTRSAEPSATATLASSPENTETPKASEKPRSTASAKPTANQRPTLKPEATPKPTPGPTDPPAPTPSPAETERPTDPPKPEDDMKVEGSSYGQKVLAGVNEVREQNGCEPLSYDGSGSLLDRCKDMAKGGTLKAPSGSNESTSKSSDGGKTMGIFSAVHAWGIGNGDYTTLYVASVVYNGTRWTIVRAE